ncbi:MULTISPECIES: 2,5-diamino-6-(ribosylamino)-4(3H)-pyrimidinone 5'-phosphate reductase [unclassified Haladaptatus]|uniref:2,5-diamino-6-(ribosylamino)-4(3H)-pyrimidinone 5'-phosphate reductase n=1 Tax=unclassified Haladaptatus TaxID=2622732 RepID=UPI00209C3608|nr:MULTISPECIES: 2,5-diamino-6-(ribosylamino)-4(3H)-pyrimidinone 5'-phosphate reductase [unclassified Haladaptatus]MCO8243852.1 2,5-diamino-6-(ribosylamino)-4(3H)-pyrimidinone 5'-phosphate reductase [Haladaptatus sp. AB643]MCO8253466.1 2,5-diamino-6-(ribosylamino)-4(3H)-pyrimidinone 5'-phosphate reductase [Haladaptatus sp. AB618]
MHVVVNAAMSADGKLSSCQREQVAISGANDFNRVDDLRVESDAIVVGVGTVLADDPSLTADDGANPTRIIADSRARTPLDAQVLDDRADTLIFVAESAPTRNVRALRGAGADVVVAGNGRVSLRRAFSELESRGTEQVMVEGGGELIFSTFEAELVNELRLYVGSLVIGGRDAPTLADGEGFVERKSFPDLELDSVDTMDDGVLLRYLVS